MSEKVFSTTKYRRLLYILSLALILIALAVPRATNLDRFVTPDEPKWLHRSANFLTALVQKDYKHTFQREHPGVTIMWASAAGFLVSNPDYVKSGPGQLERIGDFHRFLKDIDIDPVSPLKASRIISALGIIAVLFMALYYARQVFGIPIAMLGFIFVAFNPFSIALTRLLHLDGMVSALMLLALLAMMAYLYRGRHFVDLIVSATAAGLSWLTKSPALFLLPFFCFLIIIDLINHWREEKQIHRQHIWWTLKPIMIWSGIAALTFTIFFPAMWVAPLDTIHKIFVQAIVYASEGHESSVFFNGAVYSDGVQNGWFYPVNYLWRATPLTIIGLLLLMFAFILRRKIHFKQDLQYSALVLILFVVLYTTFMTMGVKKFDRYLLPVFAPLDILAAVGWVTLLTGTYQILREKLGHSAFQRYFMIAIGVLLTGALIWQSWGVMQTAPYYLSYFNPLMGGSEHAPEVMMIGWGEGLDKAARHLNQSSEAGTLRAMSWYYDGPFSYFFNGITLLEEYPINPDDLPKVDYIVIYIHQLQRQLPSEEFLAFMDQQTLEHIVRIGGIPYAYIYRMY